MSESYFAQSPPPEEPDPPNPAFVEEETRAPFTEIPADSQEEELWQTAGKPGEPERMATHEASDFGAQPATDEFWESSPEFPPAAAMEQEGHDPIPMEPGEPDTSPDPLLQEEIFRDSEVESSIPQEEFPDFKTDRQVAGEHPPGAESAAGPAEEASSFAGIVSSPSRLEDATKFVPAVAAAAAARAPKPTIPVWQQEARPLPSNLPVRPPAPRYSSFWPLATLSVSFLALLTFQFVDQVKVTAQLQKAKTDREAQVTAAGKVESDLQKIISDLLELAKTNTQAKAVIDKYQVKQVAPQSK